MNGVCGIPDIFQVLQNYVDLVIVCLRDPFIECMAWEPVYSQQFPAGSDDMFDVIHACYWCIF